MRASLFPPKESLVFRKSLPSVRYMLYPTYILYSLSRLVLDTVLKVVDS